MKQEGSLMGGDLIWARLEPLSSDHGVFTAKLLGDPVLKEFAKTQMSRPRKYGGVVLAVVLWAATWQVLLIVAIWWDYGANHWCLFGTWIDRLVVRAPKALAALAAAPLALPLLIERSGLSRTFSRGSGARLLVDGFVPRGRGGLGRPAQEHHRHGSCSDLNIASGSGCADLSVDEPVGRRNT